MSDPTLIHDHTDPERCDTCGHLAHEATCEVCERWRRLGGRMACAN